MVLNLLNCKFLVVQGRTLKQTKNKIQYFPIDWKNEFPILSKLSFDGIEWIYDKYSESTNPLLSQTGQSEMVTISKQFNIELENIVFDRFISDPFLQKDSSLQEQNITKLSNLIQHSSDVGFKRIIFPLVDKNKINSDKELSTLIKIFKEKIIENLDSQNIEIHFETSLPVKEEMLIVNELNHEKIKICFDMGNSASMGFDSKNVINTLDSNLGSVHIKERKLNGVSTPLGQGDVKFFDVFESLKEINFCGPMTFQVYRDKNSNEISILKDSLTFIKEIISKKTND